MTPTETTCQHGLKLSEDEAREVEEDFLIALDKDISDDAVDEVLAAALRLSEALSPGAINETERQAALAHLSSLRFEWNGKPIANRDELYDEIRK